MSVHSLNIAELFLELYIEYYRKENVYLIFHKGRCIRADEQCILRENEGRTSVSMTLICKSMKPAALKHIDIHRKCRT